MRSPENSKAVVIGAGTGGLALAIYLAQQGLQVDVLEKESAPGGRCGQFQQAGHRFDVGATLLLLPGLFRSIYADWGEKMEEQLQLQPLDPIYQIHFAEGGALDFTSDLPRLESQLEILEPGSVPSFRRYFRLGCRQYGTSMPVFLGKNFYSLFDYFTPANILQFLKLKAHRNHFQLARQYFKSPKLQAVFTFQNIYVGQSPYAASAIYALLPAMELAQGGFYPQGGMHGVVRNLAKLAQARGVKIRCQAPVAKLVLRGSQTRGVILQNGEEIRADLVAANADLPYVCRTLLPPSKYSRRLDRMKYTSSAIVLHWGLDTFYPQLNHHNVFLAQDYRGGFQGIFQDHCFGRPPHFYLNHPTHSDPSAAPPGQDSLSVIVPCGNADTRYPQAWEALTQEIRETVFRTLAQKGLADLPGHIKFEVVYTPPLWEDRLNLSHGSVFGSLDHSLFQSGYLRPANQHPKYSNLFFVGGSTRPGSGVPLTLLSARLTAERIFHSLGLQSPARSMEY